MEYFYEEMSLKLSIYGQPPLHPRRTLHQYRYGTRKSTEKLDKTQVVFRRTGPLPESLHCATCTENDRRKCLHAHCTEEATDMFYDCEQCFSNSRKVPYLIMVDQLWLWVLDESTVITSFPQSWGSDPHSVHHRIRTRLKALLPGEIQSAYDLSLIIVDQCSGGIFERTKAIKNQSPVLDMFQDAIGILSDKQTLAVSHFWSLVGEASRVLYSRDRLETTTMYRIFLNVIREGMLLGEIGGILDELHIMLQIQNQQKRVLKSFSKHVARLLRSRVPLPLDSARETRPGHSATMDPAENNLLHVKELTENLDDHIADLTSLQETPTQVAASLERLVDLKLQQADVIMVIQAQDASEETLKQGRSIMVFTVITIVFLPLSFVASVFSMSTAATDYRNGVMRYRNEILYMIFTSLAFALLVLIIALSSTVRAIIKYSIQVPWTWINISTNFDKFWRRLMPDNRILAERTERAIRDMKERAKWNRNRRAARKRKEHTRRIQEQTVEAFGNFRAPIRTGVGSYNMAPEEPETLGHRDMESYREFLYMQASSCIPDRPKEPNEAKRRNTATTIRRIHSERKEIGKEVLLVDGMELVKDDMRMQQFDYFKSGIVVFWTIKPDEIIAFRNEQAASGGLPKTESDGITHLRETSSTRQIAMNWEEMQKENKETRTMPLIESPSTPPLKRGQPKNKLTQHSHGTSISAHSRYGTTPWCN
ncbi:hypothetical protein N431DRAFT_462111 [Stipitochalara longipes BDJ]|nr:hypothetical protein N431DRAFT_462111 [Stipitochalara longipes BDJ]